MEKLEYGITDFEPATILIIDDDGVCIMAIKRALKKMKLANPVRVAKDGVEGLELLRGDSDQTRVEPPYIILLDINMPRMNGHEFLDQIRDDPSLRRSLIFVLTTSDAPEDIAKAYDRNVAGYVIKEEPFESLSNALELVDRVAKVVVLPR